MVTENKGPWLDPDLEAIQCEVLTDILVCKLVGKAHPLRLMLD